MRVLAVLILLGATCACERPSFNAPIQINDDDGGGDGPSCDACVDQNDGCRIATCVIGQCQYSDADDGTTCQSTHRCLDGECVECFADNHCNEVCSSCDLQMNTCTLVPDGDPNCPFVECVPGTCEIAAGDLNHQCRSLGVCKTAADCILEDVGPVCPPGETVACGTAIEPTNGCGTCAGVGLQCSTGTCEYIDTFGLLALWYPFDQPSPEADHSTNGRDAILSDPTPTWVKDGGGTNTLGWYRFEGNAFLQASESTGIPAGAAITVSVRVRLPALPTTWLTVVSRGEYATDNDKCSWGIRVGRADDTTFRWVFWVAHTAASPSTPRLVTVDTPFAGDQWFHLVGKASYDTEQSHHPGILELWIDSDTKETSNETELDLIGATNEPTHVGRAFNDVDWFVGGIDDLMVFDAELPVDLLDELLNDPKVPPSAWLCQ